MSKPRTGGPQNAEKNQNAEKKQRYVEISEWLAERCAELAPGSPVPSEAQLAEMFGVSRMTARHALETVRASGKIERRKGAGSFVAQPALHREESVLYSFSEEIRRRDATPRSIVLAAGPVILPSQALLMGLDPRQPLIKIDRVRCSNDVPVAREIVYLPNRLRGVLDADLATGSLHDALRRQGVALSRATGFVTARLASPKECELLALTHPTAMLVESRLVTDPDGAVVESTETAYVGSRWAMDTAAAVSPGVR